MVETITDFPTPTIFKTGALPTGVTLVDNTDGIGTDAILNFTLTISRRATALVYSCAITGTYSNPAMLRATGREVSTAPQALSRSSRR